MYDPAELCYGKLTDKPFYNDYTKGFNCKSPGGDQSYYKDEL